MLTISIWPLREGPGFTVGESTHVPNVGHHSPFPGERLRKDKDPLRPGHWQSRSQHHSLHFPLHKLQDGPHFHKKPLLISSGRAADPTTSPLCGTSINGFSRFCISNHCNIGKSAHTENNIASNQNHSSLVHYSFLPLPVSNKSYNKRTSQTPTVIERMAPAKLV